VIDVPDTAYAKSGDVHIAYQVVGEGPVDLLYATGIWSNVEIMWEHPPWARFLERLASFARLVLFDMRGVGLSDRGPEPPYLELQRDDIGAVMDALGIDSGIVFGGARAASMALLFAATYPERTDALIRLALDFWTWRRLAREGLDDEGAADLMAGAIATHGSA